MKPTNFQVTGSTRQTSRHTGKPVTAVFFKGDDGLSYRTWLDPQNGNYRRWENVITKGTVLTGLNVKANRLIDADSFPRLVQQ